MDKKETADDRALVDGTVSIATIAWLSAFFYAGGAAIAGYFASKLGAQFFTLALAGFVLAFFYTANPFSLKFHGLGDVVIFLCFGPLLMSATAAASSGYIGPHWPVVYMSLPLGLLTVAILHANNTRDIHADRKAGARTIAQILGFTGSYYLYIALFVIAYVATAYALAFTYAEWNGTTVGEIIDTVPALNLHRAIMYSLAPTPKSWKSTSDPAFTSALQLIRSVSFLLVVTLPWCLTLIRRFKRKALGTLPQATAQFNLLFGACVLCGLLPFDVLARLLLGVLFYLGGVNNLLMWHHTRLLVNAKLTTIIPGLPMWLTSTLAFGASVTQLVASLVFVIGRAYSRESAAILVAFLLPVTISVHDLWNADHDEAAEFRDPEAVAPLGQAVSVNAAAKTAGATKASARGRSPSATPRKRKSSDAAVSAAAEPAAAAAAPAGGQHSSDVYNGFRPSSGADGAPVAIPTFVTAFDNEFVHFFKNVGMIGGLLVYLAYAPI